MKLPNDLSFEEFIAELEKAYSFIPAVNVIINDTGMTPFKVLISAMMSARTRDEITIEAAKKLFQKADTPQTMMTIPVKGIEKTIRSINFYITKAKNIKKTAEALIRDFNGSVPDNIEDLVKLPGVGLKTAALVMTEAFQKYEICVDTHVHRIPNRLGIIKTKTPGKTRDALKQLFPKKYWMVLNRLLISFGRTTCKPVGPRCPVCVFLKYCDYPKKAVAQRRQ